jgi:hypothetical protein
VTGSPDPELVAFVRDVLGCGCPDDVVDRMVVEVSPVGEPGLDVGGRLLVRVLGSVDPDRLVTTFRDDVIRLRAERDGRGFNRLRMVVAHPDHDELGPALETTLRTIVGADDRVHVHAIEPGALPRRLAGNRADPAA